MKIAAGPPSSLPVHLKRRPYKFDMIKHYGDFTNPVEHWHLYRWGADQTKKPTAITARKAKRQQRKTFNTMSFSHDSDEIVVQNYDGHWIKIESPVPTS